MRLLICLLLLTGFASCVTQRQPVYNYLEDIRDSAIQSNVTFSEPVIQKNDMLSIQVSSASLDARVNLDYNLPALPGPTGAQPGYLVDLNGNIEMPRLGKIRAEGLTKDELEQVIKTKLKGLLTEPTVLIRFLNFRITVLGEVARPGVITSPAEQMTILEALGTSGGITQFGTIKTVRIVREYNGRRETGVLDLTSQDIFKSKFYRLQQNDVVLVHQNTARVDETARQRNIQNLTIGLSLLSAATFIFALFRR